MDSAPAGVARRRCGAPRPCAASHRWPVVDAHPLDWRGDPFARLSCRCDPEPPPGWAHGALRWLRVCGGHPGGALVVLRALAGPRRGARLLLTASDSGLARILMVTQPPCFLDRPSANLPPAGDRRLGPACALGGPPWVAAPSLDRLAALRALEADGAALRVRAKVRPTREAQSRAGWLGPGDSHPTAALHLPGWSQLAPRSAEPGGCRRRASVLSRRCRPGQKFEPGWPYDACPEQLAARPPAGCPEASGPCRAEAVAGLLAQTCPARSL